MVMLKGKSYAGSDLGTSFGHKKPTTSGADGQTRDQWENMWVDGVAEIEQRATSAAASATAAGSSETNAAESAMAAAGSATATAADRLAVAADKSAVHTDRLAADADATATAADRLAVAADKSAIHTDRLAADADAMATAADRQAVAADKSAVHTDRLAADADATATAADRLAVAADKSAVHTDRLAADASAAAAASAAAGVALPAITSADAGKTLTVKLDGSGWQATPRNGPLWAGASGGAANAPTLTPTPALGSLTGNPSYEFIATANNSGASTLNVSGTGAVSLRKADGAALSGGELMAGTKYVVTYDGAVWRLAGGGASGVFRFVGVQATSSAYTVTAADAGRLLYCTGAVAVTLLSAATAGAGFVLPIRSSNTSNVQISPSGADTLNGSTSPLTLSAANSGFIVSDGVSAWLTVGTAVPVASVWKYWRVMPTAFPNTTGGWNWMVMEMEMMTDPTSSVSLCASGFGGGVSGGNYASTPSLAFDGSTSTYWNSVQVDTGVPNAAYLGWQFNVGHDIHRIRWRTYANDRGNASAVKIQKSPDGATWTDVYSTSVPTTTSAWIDLTF